MPVRVAERHERAELRGVELPAPVRAALSGRGGVPVLVAALAGGRGGGSPLIGGGFEVVVVLALGALVAEIARQRLMLASDAP